MSLHMNWDEAYSAIDVDSPRYDHEDDLYAALEDAETSWDEVTIADPDEEADDGPNAARPIRRWSAEFERLFRFSC